MTTTYDDTDIKTRAIAARVTSAFYDAFAAKAAEVPGRTSSELARQVLERFVYEEAAAVALMEELWAFAYVVLNALPQTAPDPVAVGAAVDRLIAEARQKKAEKARALLQRPR